MSTDILKRFALIEETETSVKLIKLGLGELQNLNQTNDFYFLPFQLLSQGFERFMKSYICIAYFNTNNEYPSASYLSKSLGHSLEKLLDEIMTKYYDNRNIPVLKEDENFLLKDLQLKKLLYILSEFGKLARYYNFDVITGSSKISINPKEMWEKFESEILISNPSMMNKLSDNELHHEVYGELATIIIVIFEKYMAALTRQFNFGTLGALGNQLSIPFQHFAMLFNDSEYGVTNYRSDTLTYKAKHNLSPHKRTFKDKFQRLFNSNYKTKKITKQGYNGDWPFLYDEVIIESREKRWYVVTINGYDYALNGLAKGRYKLENPHEAGMAIIGKSMNDFTKMASKL